jgi:prefoldin subunit 5
MLEELSTRLANIIAQKRLKVKLEEDLLAVEAELQETAPRLATLGAHLDKEKIDLEKLERTSLTNLFYAALGSREDRLDKERQELLSVQLQYQQTKRQVEYLEREQERLNRRIVELAGVEAEYESLLSQKETLLRGSNQAVASQLIAYAEQGAYLASEIKELSEALQAGREVSSSLEQVLDSLESAKSWGTWDMLGGGLLSTAVKHSRIDDAREGIHDVRTKMSQFKRELADVRGRVELKIDIGEFETFADYFFDGLIFDWIVQSKIVESLERAKGAHEVIARAIEELANLEQNAQNKLNDLQEKRTHIIESS